MLDKILFVTLILFLGYFIKLRQFLVELFVQNITDLAVEIVQVIHKLFFDFTELFFNILLGLYPPLNELLLYGGPILIDLFFHLKQIFKAKLGLYFWVHGVGFQEAVAAPYFP